MGIQYYTGFDFCKVARRCSREFGRNVALAWLPLLN